VFDYNHRLNMLREEIKKRSLDALLVTNEANVSYLSGFRDGDSSLLLTSKRAFFITDSRYIEEARDSLKLFDIELVRSSTYETIEKIVGKGLLKRVGFESMNLSYEVASRLKSTLNAKLAPIKNVVEDMRGIKDSLEVKAIRKSIALAKDVLSKIMRLAKIGTSEKSLSIEAMISFIGNGAKSAFPPVISAGRNTSKPHAIPSDNTVKEDSPVMIDIGCSLEGYNSDITRMLFLGRIKAKFKEIYNIVSAAQDKAIEMIIPGRRISEIDSAARKYIGDKGFGKYFGHALGHGVGMEVHESPTVSKMNDDLLRPGMVFTVEPAIYIPKFGGVRIEDMVLVTDTGCEVLTC